MQRDLVERARDGDRDAFSAAAAASIGRLYGLATLLLRDKDLAEDAVQEALLSSWRGIRALRDPDAWDAWLQRGVVRACYRQAERDRQRSLARAKVVLLREPSATDVSGDLAARDEIEQGFRALPIEQRAVVALHFYAGLPLDEVARVMGTPEGTAKSRLHRGLQALKASFAASDRQARQRERSA